MLLTVKHWTLNRILWFSSGWFLLLLLPACPDPNDSGDDDATVTASPSPVIDPTPTQAPTERPTATPTPTAAPTPSLTPAISPTPSPQPTESPVDEDHDGYPVPADCDDGDPTIHPDADEVCEPAGTEPRDNDCDGLIDDDDDVVFGTTVWYADEDGDGHGDPETSVTACTPPDGYVLEGDDCDDTDALINPGTVWYLDFDDDGYGTSDRSLTQCQRPQGYVLETGDCDDSDPAYSPAAAETDCSDANDYNCDGSVAYEDADGDGNPACTDCNDTEKEIHPGAVETCNGFDDDCDGTVDDEDEDVTGISTTYEDADQDGYGDPNHATSACAAPEGYVSNPDDCNDEDAAIFPGTIWHLDFDGDGYGGSGKTLTQCEQPRGYVLDDTDCDDTDPRFHPGADESDCSDPNDYNCDGTVGYVDQDEDGFAACEDCADGDPAIHPNAAEVCNGVDDDCDNTIDDEDGDVQGQDTFYADTDEDGYGNPSTATSACTSPSGYVENGDDCDDTDPAINPSTVWYIDFDDDGFGRDDSRFNRTQCEQPPGYVLTSTDCNNADEDIHPGAAEYCNGVDDDCDGETDESDALDTLPWYEDSDGDGYGGEGPDIYACQQLEGYVDNSDDCDDTKSETFPGVPEICDEADNDCDDEIDEGAEGDAAACAVSDCAALHALRPELGDGIKWIKPESVETPFEAYCNMTTAGGGWTLVASVVDRSYFAGTVGTTACDTSPAVAPDETPFIVPDTAGDVHEMTVADHKSEAYSSVPFTEFLFVDSVEQYATYLISSGAPKPDVLEWYPAGLSNYVGEGVEAHPSYSYAVRDTNISVGLNNCGSLRVSFNVEDSDTSPGANCHSIVRGISWPRKSNNNCYWDDGGVVWVSNAFYKDNVSAYRLWLVR